jgi:hypothetical protein
MKYAAEMASGVMIYIQSFVNIGAGVKKLLGDTHTHTQRNRQQADLISLLLFFQNMESRLNTRLF